MLHKWIFIILSAEAPLLPPLLSSPSPPSQKVQLGDRDERVQVVKVLRPKLQQLRVCFRSRWFSALLLQKVLSSEHLV